MPPGQVSRGQDSTGLRFLARSSSLWRKSFPFSPPAPPSPFGNDVKGQDRESDNESSSSNNSNKSSASNSESGASNQPGHSNTSGNTGNPIPSSHDSDSDPKSGNTGDDSDSKDTSDNNKSKSSGSNPAGGSSSDTTSAHTSAPSGSPSGFAPPCFPPQCIQDNDTRVRYSPAWSLSPLGFFGTSHQTEEAGSSLSLNFNGTGIIVFGSVPPSSGSNAPPTASYTVDTSPPVVTAEAMAKTPILNQPLFSVSNLHPGSHTLDIKVLNVSAASPFGIQYFIVTPQALAATSASSSSLSPDQVPESTTINGTAESRSASRTTVGILAGVLGSVIFVLLCVVVTFVVIARRRQRRASRTKEMQSSLFTSTESILRYSPPMSVNYPTTSMSHAPRSVIGKSWVTTNFDTKSLVAASENPHSLPLPVDPCLRNSSTCNV
ncbi:hypothetical protein R3P38DRAFT_166832 [Favolaschia claudopus]|uniref:Uncharacterized protein n=1 Tax=Favolaschia claudopus TaxID=2862362 RepID=A0AAW0D0A1_9AGAR